MTVDCYMWRSLMEDDSTNETQTRVNRIWNIKDSINRSRRLNFFECKRDVSADALEKLI